MGAPMPGPQMKTPVTVLPPPTVKRWGGSARGGTVIGLLMTWILGPLGFLVAGPILFLTFASASGRSLDDGAEMMVGAVLTYGLIAVLGLVGGVLHGLAFLIIVLVAILHS